MREAQRREEESAYDNSGSDSYEHASMSPDDSGDNRSSRGNINDNKLEINTNKFKKKL